MQTDQTDKQTNATENIISFAKEVTKNSSPGTVLPIKGINTQQPIVHV